jgi:hypothetical protein
LRHNRYVPENAPHEPEIAAASGIAQVEIILKYDGRDVDNGTMPIEDVISALRGFSNAYGNIASEYDPNGQHQIRVAAINRSSFAVAIIAWANENRTVVMASLPVATAIITLIIKLIDLKKATKGQPPASVNIDGSNNTVIIATAGDNTELVVQREVYELYKNRTLDSELGKIVSPLRQGQVDAVSISSKDSTSSDSVVITSSEKDFFHADDTKTSTSKPTEVDGYLVSLNKESNRGRFRMQNGATVSYHFTGDNPSGMYDDFAYRGPTRVQCVATFDGNLELKGLEITKVTRLQGDLFRPPDLL